ncbi:hypothetical protein PIB30_101877 [Stylosanthes scabra]|uniref:Uncharacterized protein n=1 Tax=Stylosanthes scabra TaxID=79078 RepID=A0ABU6YXV7_9FABA|nr:hypothetical protein [Stylosanthes scabra]
MRTEMGSKIPSRQARRPKRGSPPPTLKSLNNLKKVEKRSKKRVRKVEEDENRIKRAHPS